MDLDLRKLDTAIAESFQEVVESYAVQCQIEITEVQYRWDGYTLRKSGEMAGSPRDIRDTDELFNSQQDPVYPTPDEAEIEYSADYALDVHEGSPGKPGRPWTEIAAANTDFESIMAEKLSKRLK
jgi:hypothetical protein